MKYAHHWTSLPLAALLAFAPLVACDKKEEPAPLAATTPEPGPTKAPEPDKQPEKEAAPTPTAAPKDPAPTPTAAPAAPAPTPTDPSPTPTDPAPAAGDPNTPAAGEPHIGITVTPGTVVRDPAPNSPEWLIQQVLVASLEPDFEKGWALFESLLAEDQKIEKALISRKQLNYPASRRKVNLFLYEPGPKPIYRVERVVQEAPHQYRLFLHNNSPDSMPTPCEVRYDLAAKKWGVGICSL